MIIWKTLTDDEPSECARVAIWASVFLVSSAGILFVSFDTYVEILQITFIFVVLCVVLLFIWMLISVATGRVIWFKSDQ